MRRGFSAHRCRGYWCKAIMSIYNSCFCALFEHLCSKLFDNLVLLVGLLFLAGSANASFKRHKSVDPRQAQIHQLASALPIVANTALGHSVARAHVLPYG